MTRGMTKKFSELQSTIVWLESVFKASRSKMTRGMTKSFCKCSEHQSTIVWLRNVFITSCLRHYCQNYRKVVLKGQKRYHIRQKRNVA